MFCPKVVDVPDQSAFLPTTASALLDVPSSFFPRGKKKNKGNTSDGVGGNYNIVEQLLTDPAAVEASRQEDLMLAARRTQEAASEAYIRSLSACVNKPSRAEEFPYVFDSMAELFATRALTDRSKLVLPADTRQKRTPLFESYDFPLPIKSDGENAEDPVRKLVQNHLPNGLIEISSLDHIGKLAFKGVKHLNLIQSVVFDAAYNSNDNLLISAPTGAGKTNTAMLTILHLIRNNVNPETGVLDTGAFKVVYMAPMKALAAEMADTFGKRLAPLGVRVRECTGDMQLTAQEVKETQMLVTTPEKWDVLSRKGAGADSDSSPTSRLALLIIDEIHSLATARRGAVIEALVARTLRLSETAQRPIRLVGLSATLPNYVDVAALLRVNPKRGLFFFDSRFRPVPLGMSFVGVRSDAAKALAPDNGGSTNTANEQLMNQVCYERVIEQLKQGEQVMVFVHARTDTVRTGRWFLNYASQRSEISFFEPPPSATNPEFAKRIARSSDAGLRELAPRGVGCHHAGMLRPERNLAERLFAAGALRVLVCTATLAWGVNLPAHAVVIKGTKIYDADRSDFVDLDVLDVLQIFGRAGRPQFDKFGLATIITTQDKLDHYVRLITNQIAIESQLLDNLNDHLNAEIALGTVTNVSEAVTWLSYTFLFVRLTKSPLHYGITPAMLVNDPDLTIFLTSAVESAAKALDDAEMIRFEPSSGIMASTDRGRTAALYYISYATAAMVKERLTPLMLLQDLVSLVADASEFAQMKVRDEEETELIKLQDEACQILVKNPGTVEGTLGVKVNVLLQAHISRARPTTHSLVSDSHYVHQNAGRLARYIFEIALRCAWSVCATSAHQLSKMIEHRLWYSETPLWQFIGENIDNCRILERVDEQSLRVDKIRELTPDELNAILRFQGIRGAEYVHRLAHYLPILNLSVETQPVTRNILRITVRLTADFNWVDCYHGNGGALLYWLWVENPDEACIYHSETFILNKKMYMKAKGEPLTELIFTIPIHEPLPSQYLVRCISDRYLGVESVAPVYLRNILLPQSDPPHTDLLPLDPLPLTVLKNKKYESLYSYTHFNPIQTQVFHTLYHQDVNVLLGAPTGSGKTAVAELAIFRVFNTTPEKKCVYIAPLKALVRERVDDWSVKIGKKLGKRVVELTGDVSPDAALLRQADVIVTTPEKWDGISRSWRQRNYVQKIALIIIDEIHMVGEDRGPVLEAIVSRANFIANQLNTRIRVVGLSTALANAVDMAVWLRVPLAPLGPQSACSGRGLFNFRPSVRPVPLEVHIQAYPGRHYCPRMSLMNKPIFQAIQSHSFSKPVLIFVASRRQTRRTAFSLITYASTEMNPRQWLHMDINEMEDLASTLSDQNLQVTLPYGIAIHHAGLRDSDRRIVEELFVNHKIQVLIATSTLAWGVNFPAHLVIVKGTEYFDGKTKRYIDYPITDVLQMMGRAGRPQFDNEGKAVVMVQDTKKAFYKRFLYEPFPVESCLPRILPDYINAEVASGNVESMQAAIQCITWTFYFRRLLMNPNYYQLEDTSAAGVSAFLSRLVSEAVEQLIDSGCVEVGEPEEENYSEEVESLGTPVIPLYCTPLGRLASYYYISHKTIRLYDENMSPNTSIEDLIYVLSMSEEYSELPVRHGEDELNASLARELPLKLRESPDSGHAKAHLLLQAHLCRRTGNQLPVADYITDTFSLLDQMPRLLAALLDVSALRGRLIVALRCALLGQMISRALWLSDSPLLQLVRDSCDLAAFELESANGEESKYIETLPQLLEVAGEAPRFPGLRNLLRDRISAGVVERIRKFLLCVPVVSVELSLMGGKNEQKVSIIDLEVPSELARRNPIRIKADADYALCVTLHYENIPSPLPKDNGRQSRPPGWVVILGEITGPMEDEGGTLYAMKKTTFKRNKNNVNMISLSFRFGEESLGDHELSLYLMSDTFMSIDQQLSFCIRVVSSDEGSDEEDEDYE
nr:Activating signal cointegrator 1 complex subunit [Hymenolepis microstoma]